MENTEVYVNNERHGAMVSMIIPSCGNKFVHNTGEHLIAWNWAGENIYWEVLFICIKSIGNEKLDH